MDVVRFQLGSFYVASVSPRVTSMTSMSTSTALSRWGELCILDASVECSFLAQANKLGGATFMLAPSTHLRWSRATIAACWDNLEVPGLLFKRPGLFLSGWVVSSASGPKKNVPRVKSEVKTGNCMYSCVQLAVGSIFSILCDG